MAEDNLHRKQARAFLSEKSEIRAIRDQIVGLLVKLDYPQRDVFAVRLSTNEALLNAIEHGNRCDKNKKVTISYFIDRRKAEIEVTDEGLGFDHRSIPDCTADENLCKTRGRGIALMRGLMDLVEFSDRGNTVRLVKLNSSGRSAPADQAPFR